MYKHSESAERYPTFETALREQKKDSVYAEAYFIHAIAIVLNVNIKIVHEHGYVQLISSEGDSPQEIFIGFMSQHYQALLRPYSHTTFWRTILR